MHQDLIHRQLLIQVDQRRELERARRFGTLDFFVREGRRSAGRPPANHDRLGRVRPRR